MIFSAEENAQVLEENIEAHLAQRLDYEVPTFVRTMSELKDLVGASVFDTVPGPDTERYVVFLRQSLSQSQKKALDALQSDVDAFRAEDRAVLWHRDLEAGESMQTSEVESALNVLGTRRTLMTVQRMVKKYG